LTLPYIYAIRIFISLSLFTRFLDIFCRILEENSNLFDSVFFLCLWSGNLGLLDLILYVDSWKVVYVSEFTKRGSNFPIINMLLNFFQRCRVHFIPLTIGLSKKIWRKPWTLNSDASPIEKVVAEGGCLELKTVWVTLHYWKNNFL
jgi:hypothetical protein